MDVQVIYQDGVKFQSRCRAHEILSDQPLDNHGQDEGMTAPECFLPSLGACVGFYEVLGNPPADDNNGDFVGGDRGITYAMKGIFRKKSLEGLPCPPLLRGVKRKAATTRTWGGSTLAAT